MLNVTNAKPRGRPVSLAPPALNARSIVDCDGGNSPRLAAENSESYYPPRRARLSRFASRFCCGVFSAVFFVCFFESLVFDMGFPSLQFGPKRRVAGPGRTGLSNRIAREEIAAKLRVEREPSGPHG